MRLHHGLLILSCSLSSTVAAQTTSSPDRAATGDWNALDQDLDSLVLPTAAEESLLNVSGYVRGDVSTKTRYTDGNETFDWRIYNANLVFSGPVGDTTTSYRINYEMGEANQNSLEDAFLTFALPGEFKATMGQFKAPILRSGLVGDDRTLFFMHSYLGGIFNTRDQGIMVERTWDRFRAGIAILDGLDGADTDNAFVGRVGFDVAGEGVPLVEGAYGAPADLNATIAASVMDDEGISDGVLLAFEAAMTYDRLAVAAELVTAEDGWDEAVGDPRIALGEATPWGVTVSYMLSPEFEAGYRIDFLDTPDDEHIQTLGGTYYLDGHDLKWQFGLTLDELEGRDEHTLGAGLSVSF